MHIGGLLNSVCRRLPVLMTVYYEQTPAFHVVPNRCQLIARRRRRRTAIVLELMWRLPTVAEQGRLAGSQARTWK